jgi:hypothetical protein
MKNEKQRIENGGFVLANAAGWYAAIFSHGIDESELVPTDH